MSSIDVWQFRVGFFDRVATVFLFANSSRFQYIFKSILKMLSIFSKCF